jgi:hypothetical protein
MKGITERIGGMDINTKFNVGTSLTIIALVLMFIAYIIDK